MMTNRHDEHTGCEIVCAARQSDLAEFSRRDDSVMRVLEANEHVVLCEANSNLGIVWLSPNAARALGDTKQRGSVLSLVAPESRGFVSRAIFRSARENTTRVKVRANDGRDADLVVVADNEFLRTARRRAVEGDDEARLSRTSRSTYAIGLFVFDSKRPPGSSSCCQVVSSKEGADQASRWTNESTQFASRICRQLSTHAGCVYLLAVDKDGVVTDAVSSRSSSMVGKNALDVVAAGDRETVSTAFAEARDGGAKSASQIHRCAIRAVGGESNRDEKNHVEDVDEDDKRLALTTCAFVRGGAALFLVYVACRRHKDTIVAPSILGIAEHEDQKKKRKRTLSTAILSSASTICHEDEDGAENRLFMEHPHNHPSVRTNSTTARRTVSSERRRAASEAGDEDDEWGHFVFPDGDPDFNLPPIHPTPQIQATVPTLEESLNYEAQPKDDSVGDSTQVVIDIDSLLPRQQSIENYQKVVAEMAPAPALRYSALALDSLISSVLPRPESIAAFKASMRQVRQRRRRTPPTTPHQPAHPPDVDMQQVDDDDDDDDDESDHQSVLGSECQDVLGDLVDSTIFSRRRDQRSSFSQLDSPLATLETNTFSIDSAPAPVEDTPMDTSAISGSSSSSSAMSTESMDASGSGKAQTASRPKQRRSRPPVHVVG